MDECRKEKINFLLCIGIAILVSAFILNFLIAPVVVLGQSMEPTVHDKSYAISNRLSAKEVNRFDVVTVKADGRLLIKRVIGLPGETITYEESKLYVDGEYVPEDFLGTDVRTEDFSYTVPYGGYFLMGDNREVSIDSRYYGAFSKSDLKSGDVLVIFPISEFGKVE